MAPPLSLEGALSAPEGTLRVPEGMVCKLQKGFWCPLKRFTDLLRNPLSSKGGPLSVWRGPLSVWRGPLSSPKGPSELIVGSSERLKSQMALSGLQISRDPCQLEGPARAWGPSLAGWPLPWPNPGSVTESLATHQIWTQFASRLRYLVRSVHVRKCSCTSPLTCVRLLSNGFLATNKIWTQSAQPFARSGKWVCTCARADAPHLRLV